MSGPERVDYPAIGQDADTPRLVEIPDEQQDLGPGWERRFTQNEGREYFVNAETATSQWHHPTGDSEAPPAYALATGTNVGKDIHGVEQGTGTTRTSAMKALDPDAHGGLREMDSIRELGPNIRTGDYRWCEDEPEAVYEMEGNVIYKWHNNLRTEEEFDCDDETKRLGFLSWPEATEEQIEVATTYTEPKIVDGEGCCSAVGNDFQTYSCCGTFGQWICWGTSIILFLIMGVPLFWYGFPAACLCCCCYSFEACGGCCQCGGRQYTCGGSTCKSTGARLLTGLQNMFDVQTIKNYIQAMKEDVKPRIFWQIQCFHIKKRRNRDGKTTTSRVNTHFASMDFEYESCVDKSQGGDGLDNMRLCAVNCYKTFHFADEQTKYVYNTEQNRFITSNDRDTRYDFKELLLINGFKDRVMSQNGEVSGFVSTTCYYISCLCCWNWCYRQWAEGQSQKKEVHFVKQIHCAPPPFEAAFSTTQIQNVVHEVLVVEAEQRASAAGNSAGGGIAEQIERLNKLHASGALSDAEYAQAKAKVLNLT